MKNPLFAILLSLLFLSCSSDDEIQENPYLPNHRVSFQVDLNLPQYNSLNYTMNTLVLQNRGINGIVILKTNNNQYNAFELTDPNHPISDCSILQVQDFEAVCSCDDGNIYDIITGQMLAGEGRYSLKRYQVEYYDSVIEIRN